MVREFKLLNEKGQSFSLMDIENYCLLTEPTGLGYTYSTEYEQLGNTFVENLRKLEQGQINAVANFLYYDNYKNFIDFIEMSESLVLAYKIPFKDKQEEYLRNINIQTIGKSEKQTNGAISENIVIECKSLWYKENIFIYDMTSQEREMRWDFKWDSKFVSYDIRSLQYINKGHIDAPIMLELSGELLNPKIELYVEGELMQTVNFNLELEEYEKLLYCTKENEFYIKKQNTDGTFEDLFDLDVIDFSNDNVIRLPKNKSCEIKLSADNDIQGAQIKILEYYKAI